MFQSLKASGKLIRARRYLERQTVEDRDLVKLRLGITDNSSVRRKLSDIQQAIDILFQLIIIV